MYTIVYYVYENLSSHTAWAAAGAVFLFVIILDLHGYCRCRSRRNGSTIEEENMEKKLIRQFPADPVEGYHPLDQ
jgi:hypothetical protein